VRVVLSGEKFDIIKKVLTFTKKEQT